MRLVVQRVLEASVSVSGQEVSRIGKGIMVLLGLTHGDSQKDCEKYARKLLKLRIWPSIENDTKKTWDKGVFELGLEILIVSQFTLYGILNGNKPDFHQSLEAEKAKELYNYFIEFLKKEYDSDKIKGGAFQQYMNVGLINDGPVTLVIESEPKKEQNPNKKVANKQNKSKVEKASEQEELKLID